MFTLLTENDAIYTLMYEAKLSNNMAVLRVTIDDTPPETIINGGVWYVDVDTMTINKKIFFKPKEIKPKEIQPGIYFKNGISDEQYILYFTTENQAAYNAVLAYIKDQAIDPMTFIKYVGSLINKPIGQWNEIVAIRNTYGDEDKRHFDNINDTLD